MATTATVQTETEEAAATSQRGWSPRLRGRIRAVALKAIVPAVVLGGWQLWTTLSPSFATPPLQEIAAALLELPFYPGFWTSMVITLQALVYGFVLSVLVGLPVGIISGRVKLIEGVVGPYITLILSVPTAAIVPVFVVLFGIGINARVAVVVAFALPILVGNVMTGASSTPRNLLEMGQSLGCTRMQMARRIIIPAALPEIFAGLRLAASRAVIGMVVAELIVISAGLGRLINRFTAGFQVDMAYALVIVLLAISGVFVGAVQLLETKMLSWRQSGISNDK